MESSIAVFLTWQSACELLPTIINSLHFSLATTVGRMQLLRQRQTARYYSNEGFASGKMSSCKLAWLVLGGDPAARSHRVEQLTAL